MEFLVFTLAAPLASFGALAVGERRPTDDRPTKSQVIGLVAAALGIERSEQQRQADLAACLGYAVRVDEPGLLETDYQTAEAAKEVSVRRRAKSHGPLMTRADELACDDRKTILSYREYRTGVLATIVLWQRAAGLASIARMHDALIEPQFILYAGRKAFPLMLPCRPQLVTADTVQHALAAYDHGKPPPVQALEAEFFAGRLPRRQSLGSTTWIYSDADAALAGACDRIEQRRDNPETRSKWRFGLRAEVVIAAPRAPAGGGKG